MEVSLENILQQPMSLKAIAALAHSVYQDDDSLQCLFDFTTHKNPQIAFRAAWVLEFLYTRTNFENASIARQIFEQFGQITNTSVQRHYAKIIAALTANKHISSTKDLLSTYPGDEHVIATAFDFILDEKVTVATKVCCLSILTNYTFTYSWVKEELLATMDFLLDTQSVSFFVKVREVRKILAKA